MLISPDEIQKSLASHGWDYTQKKISKSFIFDAYMEGIQFVQKIAVLAEAQNHHPDINIGWCKVGISITSHDLGGVSTKCVNLALCIDKLMEA